MAGGRTIEGLEGGIGGKGIARGIRVVVIGEVEIGEDRFIRGASWLWLKYTVALVYRRPR